MPLDLESFDAEGALRLLRGLEVGQEEFQTSEGLIEEDVDDDYRNEVGNFQCDPAVRALALPLYELLRETIGDCEVCRLDETARKLAEILELVRELLLIWTSEALKMDHEVRAQLWQDIETIVKESCLGIKCLAVHTLVSFSSTLLIVRSIRGEVTADLMYVWHMWTLTLLILRFMNPQDEEVRNVLGLLVNPCMYSLVTSGHTLSHTQMCKIGEISGSPFTLAGLLNSEEGQEHVRRLVDMSCASVGGVQLGIAFVKLLATAKMVDNHLQSNTENSLWGVARARWQRSVGMDYLTQLLHLLFHSFAPLLGGNSRGGQTNVQPTQQRSFEVVEALLLAPETWQVREATVTPSQEADGSPSGSERMEEVPEVVFTGKQSLVLGHPAATMLCQSLFYCPEKRECRERLTHWFQHIGEALLKEGHTLDALVALLIHLQHHDRSALRVISTEAAESILVTATSAGDQIATGLLAGIFNRAQDVLSTVRLRAIEALSSFLNSCSGLPLESVTWLFGEVIGSGTGGFPWKSTLTLIDLRLLDEKSAVRRATVGLLDTCLSLFSEYTPSLKLIQCRLVSPEAIAMLTDDGSVIVRQRMVHFLSASLGRMNGIERRLVLPNLLYLCVDNEESVAVKAREIIVDVLLKPSVISGENDTETEMQMRTLNSWEGQELLSRMLLSAISKDGFNGGPLLQKCLKRIVETRSPFLLPLVSILLSVAYRHRKQWLRNIDVKPMETWLQTFPSRPSHEGHMWETWRLCMRLEVSEEIRSSVRNILGQRLKNGEIPQQLVPVVTRAYFEQLSDPRAIREDLTTMILHCKGVMSNLSSSRRTEVSLNMAAVTFRVVGTLYTLSSTLPPSQKTFVHMAELAPVFATLFLALARNGFKGTHKDSVEPSHWMHDMPKWLRGVALASASQIMLAHESVAKRLMPSLIQSGLSLGYGQNLDQSGDIDPLAANLAFAVYDFTLKMTSLVDPYFPVISSQLSSPSSDQPHHSRVQILILLSKLAAQDYLKLRGLLLYHFLFALGDEHPAVRALAYRLVAGIVLPRVKDLLNAYFLEMVCFLNGFEEHPAVPLALDIHPIAAELCDVSALCIDSFRVNADVKRRLRIYSAMLSFASDSQRHEVMKRLLYDFLQGFIPSRQASATGTILEVPVSRSSGGGRAMSDVLTVLSSADLRLTFASAVPADKAGPTSDPTGEEDVLLQREQRARFNRAILKQYLSKSVLPILISTRRALQEKTSALQREVNACLAQLLYEWQDDLEDMTDDSQLLAQLKRWYGEESTDDGGPLLSFNEAFLGERLRGNYVQKPLRALLGDSDSACRRSTMGVECVG